VLYIIDHHIDKLTMMRLMARPESPKMNGRRWEWATNETPPCDRSQVQPETTVTGYSTGNVACGQTILKKNEGPRK
jgi:hypothetical protein